MPAKRVKPRAQHVPGSVGSTREKVSVAPGGRELSLLKLWYATVVAMVVAEVVMVGAQERRTLCG